MKRFTTLLTAAALSSTILMTSSFAMASELPYGSAGAAADTEYTLEEILTYAIQDEYAAQAEYDLIMDNYGTVRPFSNIIKAEANHINLLLPLFETYGVEVPVNDAAQRTVLPSSLAESYQTAVKAEENNIAMYQKFLEDEGLPADVRDVLEKLSAASENHLAAFERAANGQVGAGLGKGRAADSGSQDNMGPGGRGRGNSGICINQ